jgi:hypothetical protein
MLAVELDADLVLNTRPKALRADMTSARNHLNTNPPYKLYCQGRGRPLLFVVNNPLLPTNLSRLFDWPTEPPFPPDLSSSSMYDRCGDNITLLSGSGGLFTRNKN